MAQARKTLRILLIARNGYRIAMLKQAMHKSGVECHLQIIEQSKIAAACLRGVKPYDKVPAPDLVMVDFGSPGVESIARVRDIAFGERRSTVPVVLLTGPVTARMLDDGDIDGGDAIMFSPHSLVPFLSKLAGKKRDTVVAAVGILYQYGPFLIRQPDEFLDYRCAAEQRLSA